MITCSICAGSNTPGRVGGSPASVNGAVSCNDRRKARQAIASGCGRGSFAKRA
jgi:hypothetical protein